MQQRINKYICKVDLAALKGRRRFCLIDLNNFEMDNIKPLLEFSHIFAETCELTAILDLKLQIIDTGHFTIDLGPVV